MKICFFSENMTFKGGAEKYSIKLASELSDNGFDTFLLSLYSDYDHFDRLYKNKVRQRSAMFKIANKLAAYIDKNSIDIIICIGHGLSSIANLAKFYANRNFEVVFHSHVPFTASKGFASKLSLFSNKFFGNHIVCLTERDKVDYVEFIGDSSKVSKINNLVDYEFRPVSFIENNFIAIGYLSDRKNFLELVDIFDEYLLTHPSAKLSIFGEGPQYELLLESIREKGLEDNVFLMGFREPLEIFSQGGALLMTSKSEGLPLCILEAFSFGLPCISYDCHTGPQELIGSGTGYLISEGDKKSFLEAMLKIQEEGSFSLRCIEGNLKKYEKGKIVHVWCGFLNRLGSALG